MTYITPFSTLPRTNSCDTYQNHIYYNIGKNFWLLSPTGNSLNVWIYYGYVPFPNLICRSSYYGCVNADHKQAQFNIYLSESASAIPKYYKTSTSTSNIFIYSALIYLYNSVSFRCPVSSNLGNLGSTKKKKKTALLIKQQ